MLIDFFQALLAFILAFLITWIELATSAYPRTVFLLKKSRALYVYAAIYGVLGAIMVFLLDVLTATGSIKLEGIGLGNPWVQAVIVGISIKPFLHIRLFSVSIDTQTFPVGIESIVQIFEPWLLRTIDLNHYNRLMEFISSHAQQYIDLDEVKRLVFSNFPPFLTDPEKVAFRFDVEETESVIEVMIFYLHLVGRESFDRVFPLTPDL